MIALTKAAALSQRVSRFDLNEKHYLLSALLYYSHGLEEKAHVQNVQRVHDVQPLEHMNIEHLSPRSIATLWLGITDLLLEFGGYDPLYLPTSESEGADNK